MAYNNHVIHGRHYTEDKIKFTGRNTQMNLIWKVSGNTYKDIYNELVNMDVITRFDYDPVDNYILNKLNKTYEDYIEDGDIDYFKLYKDGEMHLTDEAYLDIISKEKGNAYYQEWDIE